MTANCPMCGAKWFAEDEDYSIILRCGDEHDIMCIHCKHELEFVLSRKDLEKVNNVMLRHYEQLISDLEGELKKAKENK